MQLCNPLAMLLAERHILLTKRPRWLLYLEPLVFLLVLRWKKLLGRLLEQQQCLALALWKLATSSQMLWPKEKRKQKILTVFQPVGLAVLRSWLIILTLVKRRFMIYLEKVKSVPKSSLPHFQKHLEIALRRQMRRILVLCQTCMRLLLELENSLLQKSLPHRFL